MIRRWLKDQGVHFQCSLEFDRNERDELRREVYAVIEQWALDAGWDNPEVERLLGVWNRLGPRWYEG